MRLEIVRMTLDRQVKEEAALSECVAVLVFRGLADKAKVIVAVSISVKAKPIEAQ